MTDAELIEAQHRVILNMPCSCPLEWKHAAEMPKCQKCRIVEAYEQHVIETAE